MEKRQIACVIREKRRIAFAIMEKRKIGCAMTEKRQIACVIMRNIFVVPLFYEIVRRFYVAHISHRTHPCKRQLFEKHFSCTGIAFSVWFSA